MKLTGKKKFYFLLAGLVLFCGIFGYFIFGPWSINIGSYDLSGIMSQINIGKQSFIDLNKSYFLMTKKRDLLYELEADYSSVKDKMPIINGAILNQDKALDFLVMIEGLAEKTGVYKDISISNLAMDDSIKTNVYPLVLKVYGPFAKVVNFVELLQNSPWILKMGRVDITREEANSVSVGKDTKVDIKDGDVQAIIEIRVLAK